MGLQKINLTQIDTIPPVGKEISFGDRDNPLKEINLNDLVIINGKIYVSGTTEVGSLYFDDNDNKWYVGILGSEKEVVTTGDDQVITNKILTVKDNSSNGTDPEVVNVLYGVAEPPTGSTAPTGTIYIKYNP